MRTAATGTARRALPAAVVLTLLCGVADAFPAEVYWQGVTRAAQSYLPEQLDGEKAVLDALEKRAREALARLKHPGDRDQWCRSVPVLRGQLTAAVGADRLPEAKARNLRVVGTVDRGDYVIEKIVYETLPSCPVAAHVYRPAKPAGRLPAILFPPGHSSREGKSHPDTQAFGISMARWGFVVLVYEPHGEGERGISMRDHRRTELLLAGLSQQAVPVFESRCALEYLLSRPDVDPKRVGITGESGGGYNTWVMTALEPRIAAAVPVVGTSEFFEQVQVCRTTDFYLAREHCHFIAGLFRFANNHHFVALAAPRPVLVVAAHNDYNFRIPGIRKVVGYGRDLYKALDASERLGYFEDTKTPHGYQRPKREAAYGWFRRWLQGQGSGEPVPEPDVKTVPADTADLRCFPQGQNQPAGPGIITQINRLIDEFPTGQEPPTVDALRRTLRDVLGVEPSGGEPDLRRGQRRLEGGAVVERLEWVADDGVLIPALLVALPGPRRGVLLACADGGKESLLDHPGVRAAVESGLAVVAADVRGAGELAVRKPGWVFATSLMLGENFVGRQALDLITGRLALTKLDGLKGKPVGLLGSGPFAAQASLYAAALDGGFNWLVAGGGFLSFRSFIDRPTAMRASYRLAPSFDAAWDVTDREVPAALFAFDMLRRLDLADLYSALAPRPALILGPIDGERLAHSAEAAERLLRAGRFRWAQLPRLAVGEGAEKRLRDFITEQVTR